MDFQVYEYIRKMPAVLGFVAATAIVSIIASLIGPETTQSLGLTPASMSYGHLHTMITYAFLYADFMHWFFNSLFIIVLGLLLETRIGSFRTSLILILGILSFSISSVVFDKPSTLPMIGSSGAAYSLLAAYGITLFRAFKTISTWERVFGFMLVVIPLWGLITSLATPVGRGRLLATAVGVVIMSIYISLTRELIETQS
jgi:membrane associated rhomboid family serine protease